MQAIANSKKQNKNVFNCQLMIEMSITVSSIQKLHFSKYIQKMCQLKVIQDLRQTVLSKYQQRLKSLL